MTENYPPVPPAPQQPEGQPFTAPGNFQGSQQPPQYTQAPPPAYGQQPYPQQPHSQQQYGQPQYAPYPPQQYAQQWSQPVAPKPKASGFRVAAGIVGIVLGFILLLASGVGFGANVIAGLLLLIAALGNIAAGIVLLAMQRGKTRGAPITAISFAGFALLAAIMAIPFAGGAILFFTVLLAVPLLVLMGMGLSREMKEEASPSYSGS
ncbi:hypothetical protein [Pseudarthrobacter sp. BIM B-2242]|uniref:hypothetical protein n=1 Tax=Pseudarthrobacter sp. BIM B-2242 TaxID=2772401 RepID=UPI00168A7F83|nr:hypothetical protein [Pseudarthrobacter sp. BIM B-2242]QOD06146.1 hypothetical protein IDT60_21545 [Pseudarthrobacter sp. BIM B-2242]